MAFAKMKAWWNRKFGKKPSVVQTGNVVGGDLVGGDIYYVSQDAYDKMSMDTIARADKIVVDGKVVKDRSGTHKDFTIKSPTINPSPWKTSASSTPIPPRPRGPYDFTAYSSAPAPTPAPAPSAFDDTVTTVAAAAVLGDLVKDIQRKESTSSAPSVSVTEEDRTYSSPPPAPTPSTKSTWSSSPSFGGSDSSFSSSDNFSSSSDSSDC